MRENSEIVGANMFGTASGPGRPLNSYRPWQYALVLFLVILGGIYAAPNLYPPDFALQITAQNPDAVIDERVLDRARTALSGAGIEYFGDVVAEGSKTGMLRVRDAGAQLQGQKLLQQALRSPSGEQEYIVALNLAPTTPDWLADIGGEPMKRGLDLAGGVHFVLEVDMARAVADLLASYKTDLEQVFREEGTRYRARDTRIDDDSLTFTFRNEETRSTARGLIASKYNEFELTNLPLNGNLAALRIRLLPATIRAREDYAIDQNLVSLRNRVNEIGVSEPLVQRFGRDRIVVDLPGIQDSSLAKKILGKVANLDFRLVANAETPPSSRVTYPYRDGERVEILRANIVSGESVIGAQQDLDPETGQPQVSVTLDGDGGDKMFRATSPNIGRGMAILFKETKVREVDTGEVDEEGLAVTESVPYEVKRLISVATIQAGLANRFRITGLSLGEARELSLLLRAGALAAPMFIVEERTVGATLGSENVLRGFQSVAVGFGLVLLFMVFYYKLFGLAANVALTVNLVLLIAVMSLLGATLTLPGIAGIVLTVGMSVDANVLIFSRIKEELKDRSPQQAISAGFDRAYITIVDANITTLIVAMILYLIGSGPVKGFAVTLAIGIVTSMFTAIMGTRAIINLIYGGRRVERLAI